MTKNVLFAGVSALAFALSATVAFADGDFNTATGNNNIATNGSTQLVAGNNSLNNVSVAGNSGNIAEDNTNALNTGQIAGGTNNLLSGNTVLSGNTSDTSGNGSNNNVTADNNGSNNLTVNATSFDLSDVSNHSRNYDNSATFAGAVNVSANVLNSTVAMNSVDYAPTSSTSIQGNVIDSSLDSFTGAASLVQNNGQQNNVQAALSVNVGTVNSAR